MSRFAAVLFDLDGTLCRRDQDPSELFRAAFDHTGTEPFGSASDLWSALDGPVDSDDVRETAEPSPAAHQTSSISEDEVGYLADGFARLAATHGRDADATALARAFIQQVDNGAVSFLSGAESAIEDAREHGHVGLLTNGPERRQSVKLDALGLLDAFDVVVYAGDMPRRKPHPDPFDRALDELDEAPDDALYVGDSLEYDVAGAQGAGLWAAWCPQGDPDPGDHHPDFTFETLHDLAGVL